MYDAENHKAILDNVRKAEELGKFLETPEGKAAFEKHMKEHLEKHSDDNGRCRDKDCGGQVVKRVHGFCSIGYIFSIPYCLKCGRKYIFASNEVPAVGHREFEKRMQMRFTI